MKNNSLHNSYWSKVILVTGGLGFIGSHFIELALSRGFSIVNVDKITYASIPEMNNYFEKKFSRRYRFIKKDVNDLEELPFCHYVVHFAAESHVDNSINNGEIFVRSNILGTQNLLELLVRSKNKTFAHSWQAKLPIFVYISTDEVFGDRKRGFFKEKDRHNPSNPYSASKAAAEMLVMAYGRTYGIPYKITRTTNNYGIRQHPEKLIPNCISRVSNGEKIKIHGSGEQVRNWIHVKDNCEGIMKIMLESNAYDIFHIASDEEYTVNDVARLILHELKKPFNAETVEYIQDRSGQDVRYALNCNRIKSAGWKPKRALKESISEMVKYYEHKIA